MPRLRTPATAAAATPTSTSTSTNTRRSSRSIRAPERFDEGKFDKPDPSVAATKKKEREDLRRAREGEIPFPQSPDVPGVKYHNTIEIIKSRKPSSAIMREEHVFDWRAARAIARKARESEEVNGWKAEREEWERKQVVRKEEERRELMNDVAREEVIKMVGERRDRIEGFLEILGVEQGAVALRRLCEAGLLPALKQKFSVIYKASPTGARCKRVVDVAQPEWQLTVVDDEQDLEAAAEKGLREEMDFSDSDDGAPASSAVRTPTKQTDTPQQLAYSPANEARKTDTSKQLASSPDHKMRRKTWSDLSDGVKFIIYEELRKTRTDDAALNDLLITDEQEIELTAIVEAEVERSRDEQICDESLQKRMDKLFHDRSLIPNMARGKISLEETMTIIEEESYEGPRPINDMVTQKEIEDGMSFLGSVGLPSQWMKDHMGQLIYTKPGELAPEPGFQLYFAADDDGNRTPEELNDMDRDDLTIEQLKARIAADNLMPEEYRREIEIDEDDPRWEIPDPEQTIDVHGIYRLEPLSKKARTKKEDKKRARSMSLDDGELPKPAKKAKKAPIVVPGTKLKIVDSNTIPGPHRRRPSLVGSDMIPYDSMDHQEWSSESDVEFVTPNKHLPTSGYRHTSSEASRPVTPRPASLGSSPPEYRKRTSSGIKLKIMGREGHLVVEGVSPSKSPEESPVFTPRKRKQSSPTGTPSSHKRPRIHLKSSSVRKNGQPGEVLGPVELSHDPDGNVSIRPLERFMQNKDGKIMPYKVKIDESSPPNVRSRVAAFDNLNTHQLPSPSRAVSGPAPSSLFSGSPSSSLGSSKPTEKLHPRQVADPNSAAAKQALSDLSQHKKERDNQSFKELNNILPPQREQGYGTPGKPSQLNSVKDNTRSPDSRGVLRKVDPKIPAPTDPEYMALSPKQKLAIEKSRNRGGNTGMKRGRNQSTGLRNVQNASSADGRVTKPQAPQPERYGPPGSQVTRIPGAPGGWDCEKMTRSLASGKSALSFFQNPSGAGKSISQGTNSQPMLPNIVQTLASAKTSSSKRKVVEVAAAENTPELQDQVGRFLHLFVGRLWGDTVFRSRFEPSTYILQIRGIPNPTFENSMAIARHLLLVENPNLNRALAEWSRRIAAGKVLETVFQESAFTYQGMLIYCWMKARGKMEGQEDKNKYRDLTRQIASFVRYFYQRVEAEEDFKEKFLPAARILGIDKPDNYSALECQRVAQKFVFNRVRYAILFAECSKAWERPDVRSQETVCMEKYLEDVLTKKKVTEFLTRLVGSCFEERNLTRREQITSWALLLGLVHRDGDQLALNNRYAKITEELVNGKPALYQTIAACVVRMNTKASPTSLKTEPTLDGQLDSTIDARLAQQELEDCLDKEVAKRSAQLNSVPGTPLGAGKASSPTKGHVRNNSTGSSGSSPGAGFISPKASEGIKKAVDSLESFLAFYGPYMTEKYDQVDDTEKKKCVIALRACGLDQLDRSGIPKKESARSVAGWFFRYKNQVAMRVVNLWPKVQSGPAAKAELDEVLEEMTRDETIKEVASFLRYFIDCYQHGDDPYRNKWRPLRGICGITQQGGRIDCDRHAQALVSQKLLATQSLALINRLFHTPATQDKAYRKLDEFMSAQVNFVTRQLQKYLQSFIKRYLTMTEGFKKDWQQSFVSRHELLDNENVIDEAKLGELAYNMVFGDFVFGENLAMMQIEVEKAGQRLGQEEGVERSLELRNMEAEMDHALYKKWVASYRSAGSAQVNGDRGAAGSPRVTVDSRSMSQQVGEAHLSPNDTGNRNSSTSHGVEPQNGPSTPNAPQKPPRSNKEAHLAKNRRDTLLDAAQNETEDHHNRSDEVDMIHFSDGPLGDTFRNENDSTEYDKEVLAVTTKMEGMVEESSPSPIGPS